MKSLALKTAIAGALLGLTAGAALANPAHGLSALTLNPQAEDPHVTFENWREQNKITIRTTPAVERAFDQYLAIHGRGNPAHRPHGKGALPTTGVSGDANASAVPGYQGEVTIAVNPSNPQQIVAGANTFYQDPSASCQSPSGTTYGTQALYYSGDGGTTWGYVCAPWPSNLTGGVGTEFFGSDPTVTWDANGNAYATYMLISSNTAGTSTSGAIVTAISSNGGATWSPYGIVVNDMNSSSSFDDKEMMAIDRTSGGSFSHTNRKYVIWDNNNTERVAYSDTGSSWSTVVVENSTNSGTDIGGDVAVGSDGTVYAIWNRLIGGSNETSETTVFIKSTNGGQTWSSPATIATHRLLSFGSNNKPPVQDQRGINAFGSIAVDDDTSSSHLGSLYVVYTDFPSGTTSGTNTDIYEVQSTNGGSSWSSPLKLNDDTGTASQFFPWVSVDHSSGNVAVSWYDTRNDTANKHAQTVMTYSTNGGGSWQPNVLVTVATSQFSNSTIAYYDENSTDNTAYNGNQYGDYAQISVANGVAHPIWTDSRQFYPGNSTNTYAEDVGTASVTLSSGGNTTPTASNGSVTTNAGTAVNGTLSASDTDGDALTFAVVAAPAHGTVSITNSSTGAFIYTPASGFSGSDSFTFHATDSVGNVSNTATESVTVNAVNTVPTASNGSVTTTAGTAVNGTLSASDTDGDALTFAIVANPANGSVSITNTATGAFTYTPASGFSGSDSFTFHATDSVGNVSNTATENVTVNAVGNATPTASNGSVSTNAGTAVNGTLSASDTDGDALTFAVVAAPAHGTVSITNSSTGAFTYTPASGFSGSDSFTFHATDSVGNVSNTATESVTVNPVSSGCASGYTTYTGNITQGSDVYEPNNTYYHTSVTGVNSGVLSGPSGTDFDLYLYKWNSSRGWQVVASSTGPTSSETINYNGTSGYYEWDIYAYSGSGSFQFCLKHP